MFWFCSAFFSKAAFLCVCGGGVWQQLFVFAPWPGGYVACALMGGRASFPLLSITVRRPAPSLEAKIALARERKRWGLLLTMEYLKNTQLRVALFNAAHSLNSLNRCLETGSCLFWMSTHTLHLPPPPPHHTCYGVCGPLDFSFCLPPSHCLTLRGPAPGLPQGFGVWNAQSMQYSWTQLCIFIFSNIVQYVFFSSFCVYIIFPPRLHLIYL